jgi:hydrogenase maturation protease
MRTQRILIAGIGNIFLGGDAFGVEVAQQMSRLALPEGVRVADFGIRGFDLAYALLDDYDATIMVDATPRGGAPGTLYLIEPDLDMLNSLGTPAAETHNLDPMKVLQLVKMLVGSHGTCWWSAASRRRSSRKMGTWG